MLAGLNARALTVDGGRPSACAEKNSHCYESETLPQHSQDHDGEDCPLDSHHHHCCCFYVGALVLEIDAECHLTHPSASFSGFRHEGEIPPDGPFLSSEKPPLI
ncbi:MAG: hypothetical protein ABI600_08285 [Luteolibacter sp.]